MAAAAVKNTGRIENLTNAGRGRPKGARNKSTIAVKEAVLAALEKAGGVEYLVQQAKDNPSAFMTLVGKVIPLQVTGEDGAPIQVEQVQNDAAAFTSAIIGLAARNGESGKTGGAVH